MAEATSITFTPVSNVGSYRTALVTATVSSGETITLDDHEYACDTIVAAFGQVDATGAPLTFAYSGNVLTLSTSSITDADVKVLIFY